ncbi:hypothetical protein AMATHDRAFT_9115 [Amanita thiersii Skay4041]|uniref:CCHC-type domain-containing protein n=1 Tax=Amanita thiersii Skay4041 TaxID=703135 RepID=A0A2A9NB71_9AGAR|nr:hypothetical protein AMATHDRAFT_9115 [Amanita thiersii Skay4041]
MVGGSGGGSEEPDWSLDQAMIQIQQLVNSVAALQNTIQQQNAVIHQLQTQQPAGNTGGPPRGPKMATPPIYDGSMANCYMQMGMAQMFRDHFLAYMATPEFQTQYEQSTEPDQIELLYRDIYKVFGDPNKQATAIQESYMRSGYGETAGIHEFKRSLNSPLLDKCMAIPELLVTLEKWYELVIQLDRQWRQAVAERKVFATRGSSGTGGQTSATQRAAQRNWRAPANQPQQQPQPQWRSPTQSAPRDPNAMQVDWNRTPIWCYNCNQTGHIACACPHPRQQQTCLMNAWNNGSDADCDELWRMMGGGREQVGGGIAHIEEIPVETPTAVQPPVTPMAPQGFRFGQ